TGERGRVGAAAQNGARRIILVVESIRFRLAELITHLERVLLNRPAEVVADRIPRINTHTPPAESAYVVEREGRGRRRRGERETVRQRFESQRLRADGVAAVR